MNVFSMPPKPSHIPLSVVPDKNDNGVALPSKLPAPAAPTVLPPIHLGDTLKPAGFQSGPSRPIGLEKIPAAPTGTEKASSRVAMAANKLVVSAYKVIGFAILIAILYGLVSYLAVHAFYFASSSWAVPMVLSPNDDRVLRIVSQMAQEKVRRDAIVAQRLEFQTRLADARRTVESETAFQGFFKVAIDKDLATRSEALRRFEGLLPHYERTKEDVLSASRAYAGMSKDRIQSDFASRLIDHDAMVNGSFQLAEIAGANLSLRERAAELDDRIAGLRHDVGALENARTGGARQAADLSYEVAHMQHEFDVSVRTGKRAEDDARGMTESIAMIDRSLAEYESLLQKLASSPYVTAAESNATLAFVPYENRAAAREGAPIYACRAEIAICSKVGHVGATLPGEVVDKHPLSGHDIRGVMVRMVLDDPRGAESAVIHLGRAPLFL